jgi:hypothetical protein
VYGHCREFPEDKAAKAWSWSHFFHTTQCGRLRMYGPIPTLPHTSSCLRSPIRVRKNWNLGLLWKCGGSVFVLCFDSNFCSNNFKIVCAFNLFLFFFAVINLLKPSGDFTLHQV